MTAKQIIDCKVPSFVATPNISSDQDIRIRAMKEVTGKKPQLSNPSLSAHAMNKLQDYATSGNTETLSASDIYILQSCDNYTKSSLLF